MINGLAVHYLKIVVMLILLIPLSGALAAPFREKDPCKQLMILAQQQPTEIEKLDPSPQARKEAINLLSQKTPSLFTFYLRQVLLEYPDMTSGDVLWAHIKSRINAADAKSRDRQWLSKLIETADSDPVTLRLVEDLLEELAKHKEIFKLNFRKPELQLAKTEEFVPKRGEPFISDPFFPVMILFVSPIFLSQLFVGEPLTAFNLIFTLSGWEIMFGTAAYLVTKYDINPRKKRISENRRRKKLFKSGLKEFRSLESSVLSAIKTLELPDNGWAEREAARTLQAIHLDINTLSEHTEPSIPARKEQYDFKEDDSDKVLRAFWLKDGEVVLAQLKEYLVSFSGMLKLTRPQNYTKELVTVFEQSIRFAKITKVLTYDQVSADLMPALLEAKNQVNEELKKIEEANQVLQRLKMFGEELGRTDKVPHVETALSLLYRGTVLSDMHHELLLHLKDQLEKIQIALILPPTSHGLIQPQLLENLITLFEHMKKAFEEGT